MRALVQRVSQAAVDVGGRRVGAIGGGLLVLLGVKKGDTEADAVRLAQKVAALRIFSDDDGKMNRSLADVGGDILVVSQFTLYGDCRKGNRPNFMEAAPAPLALSLYEKFVETLIDAGFSVEQGEFGAHMMVSSVNDGPVTLLVESD